MDSETKKKISNIFFWTMAPLIIFGLSYGAKQYQRNVEQLNKHRKSIICPSLLSIGRSSRDTLIVMKNEPLCNQFVLDSLK
jgi:hypothetical protein